MTGCPQVDRLAKPERRVEIEPGIGGDAAELGRQRVVEPDKATNHPVCALHHQHGGTGLLAGRQGRPHGDAGRVTGDHQPALDLAETKALLPDERRQNGQDARPHMLRQLADLNAFDISVNNRQPHALAVAQALCRQDDPDQHEPGPGIGCLEVTGGSKQLRCRHPPTHEPGTQRLDIGGKFRAPALDGHTGQLDEQPIGARRGVEPGLPRHNHRRAGCRRARPEGRRCDLAGALGQSRGAADHGQHERPTRQDGPRAHESPRVHEFAPVSTLRDHLPVRSSKGGGSAMIGDRHLPVVSNGQQSPRRRSEAISGLSADHLLKISWLLTAPFIKS